MPSSPTSLPSTLKLLSDPVRLRLCALVARSELAVQELVDVTGLQQSRISNHLSRLKRAGVVRDRREGTWSFHSLVEPREGGPLTPALFQAAIEPWLASEDGQRDLSALAAVLDRRRSKSREMHDRLAQRWPETFSDFTSGTLRAELVAEAFPLGPHVADLGCGAGFLALWLAERGAQVVAVDHSDGMLATARSRPGAAHVTFRRGELDDLPLADGEVDCAFANLVWHHLPDQEQAAREVFRIVRPGGRVIVSDLVPHDRDWMREAMGDLRLGQKPEQVAAALARAGFVDLVVERVHDRYRVASPDGGHAEFAMFLVRGSKPAVAPSSVDSVRMQ